MDSNWLALLIAIVTNNGVTNSLRYAGYVYSKGGKQVDREKWLIADEVARLESEGLSYIEATDKATEMYKEKAPRETDQDILKEHTKSINDIISEFENVDNGEVYIDDVGYTDRDLI